MKYNFDELIDRRNTGCVKWDESPSPDVIPLWVADMDFAVAPAIQEAILRRAQHPVFGYTLMRKGIETTLPWGGGGGGSLGVMGGHIPLHTVGALAVDGFVEVVHRFKCLKHLRCG